MPTRTDRLIELNSQIFIRQIDAVRQNVGSLATQGVSYI